MTAPPSCMRRCDHCCMLPVSVPACIDADDVTLLCEDCAEEFTPCPGCALPRYRPDSPEDRESAPVTA